MADSIITKRALAAALQELMEEVPFEKINVAHICEKCNMNRKSFYYHFKDKYDLVNWIFDTEFIALSKVGISESQPGERWEFIEQTCNYFYENRSFYCKALKIKGQNSFSEHLREYCFPLLKLRLEHLIGSDVADEFTVSFFADAVIGSMERWLLDKECMPPGQFVSKIKLIVQGGATAIYQEMNDPKGK